MKWDGLADLFRPRLFPPQSSQPLLCIINFRDSKIGDLIYLSDTSLVLTRNYVNCPSFVIYLRFRLHFFLSFNSQATNGTRITTHTHSQLSPIKMKMAFPNFLKIDTLTLIFASKVRIALGVSLSSIKRIVKNFLKT